MKIKYLSLDFWDTIATPNKNHGVKRNQWLSEKTGKSWEEIKASYQSVKNDLDYPKDGIQLDAYEVLGATLGIDDIEEMRSIFHESFINNPPSVLSETAALIKEIQRKGIKVGIGSNTNLIPGRILKERVLKGAGIEMNFHVFSDEIGYVKPSAKFYEKTMEFSGATNESEICHIGDDFQNDFAGPTKFGFLAIKIDNASKLPIVLEDIIRNI